MSDIDACDLLEADIVGEIESLPRPTFDRAMAYIREVRHLYDVPHYVYLCDAARRLGDQGATVSEILTFLNL